MKYDSPFSINDPVRLSAKGLETHGISPVGTGVVVGHGRDHCIRVRLTGRKSVNTYSESFWEKDTPKQEGATP